MNSVRKTLDELLAKRILVLDGAMGTMVQRYQLTEADFRGERFRAHATDLRAHQEEWVRSKLGDRRLGFDDDELKRMLTAAGLADVKVGVGARKVGDPFTVLIASGTKDATKHTKTRKHENG